MALRQCDSAHCSGADAELYQLCIDLGLDVGYPVLTRDANGPCTCACSCLAFGTPVQAAEGEFRAIEEYQVGDTVLAAGRSLEWSPVEVRYSAGTSGASLQKFAVLVAYLDTALVVTSDHEFLMPDGSLKRADRLTPDDSLVAPDGEAVPVRSATIGDYFAGFHHIATSLEEPSGDLTGHLLNTNGVISADYIVQITDRVKVDASGFVSPDDLIVGSPEYVQRYGQESRNPPELPVGLVGSELPVAVARYAAEDHKPGTFIAAGLTGSRPTEGACSFISHEEAALRAQDPRRAFNDPNSRQWTDALVRYHRAFYPEITYHVDWAEDEVNAYAWVESGVRHVSLKGGLIRHSAMEVEGIALVLAHEIAHHYGGPPTFPEGLSCEGEADYSAVRDMMRKIWFGEDYIIKAEAGIQQMADFFHVPNSPNPPGGSAGCNHPAGACRVATYHAAIDLRGKPACAA